MQYPSSTYRIQLNASFTFKHLLSIVDYLNELGISTLYVSPITIARRGSMHGYDVTDPTAINPEIGTLTEFRELAHKLKEYGMSWIQDIVPNHMAFSFENGRLMDVLERGNESSFYHYFDIDWEHPEANRKVWIPLLNKAYEQALEAGELKAMFNEQGFILQYEAHRFPLSIQALKEVLHFFRQDKSKAGLCFTLEDYLKGSARKEWKSWREHRQKQLMNLMAYESMIQEGLESLQADKKIWKDILNHQPYQLVHWEQSNWKMNYRRFFSINDLIALRMEEKFVFDDYHATFFNWYKEGLIQGFRIDHIDGLKYPLAYLQRLRKKLGEDCYLVVEKILGRDERLPVDWPVQGTSGYDFISFTNQLLADEAGAEKIRQFYHAFTGSKGSFKDLVFSNKRRYLLRYMAGELEQLILLLQREGLLHSTTLTTDRIREALSLFVSAFSVYRIYPAEFPLTDQMKLAVEQAYHFALEKDRLLKAELEFIQSLFIEYQKEDSASRMDFITRVMQLTGPLAAKGIEDTTFYRYTPLISHNEVGDDPMEYSFLSEEFHRNMYRRFIDCAHTLNASSTHDTKRGEDARARILALSHLSHKWEIAVMEWTKTNDSFIRFDNGRRLPSTQDEYFIYQSLVGAFPEDYTADEKFIERSCQFILKALREADHETSYTEIDNVYEEQCVYFVKQILSNQQAFLFPFVSFLREVDALAFILMCNQVVLKMTAPGIPDFYQGCEALNLSCVDPDNRRSVDFEWRKKQLKLVQQPLYGIERESFAGVKMYITYRLLQVRKMHEDLFSKGEYQAIEVKGQEEMYLAFIRHVAEQSLLVVIPLKPNELLQDVTRKKKSTIEIILPKGIDGNWQNIFTNENLQAHNGALSLVHDWKAFPAAVFIAQT